MIKAWKATADYAEYSIVIFAETEGKAKYIASRNEAFDGIKFTDICVKRLPKLDSAYNGCREADWSDRNIRTVLVKEYGWMCAEPITNECAECPALECCDIGKEVLRDAEK